MTEIQGEQKCFLLSYEWLMLELRWRAYILILPHTMSKISNVSLKDNSTHVIFLLKNKIKNLNGSPSLEEIWTPLNRCSSSPVLSIMAPLHKPKPRSHFPPVPPVFDDQVLADLPSKYSQNLSTSLYFLWYPPSSRYQNS